MTTSFDIGDVTKEHLSGSAIGILSLNPYHARLIPTLLQKREVKTKNGRQKFRLKEMTLKEIFDNYYNPNYELEHNIDGSKITDTDKYIVLVSYRINNKVETFENFEIILREMNSVRSYEFEDFLIDEMKHLGVDIMAKNKTVVKNEEPKEGETEVVVEDKNVVVEENKEGETEVVVEDKNVVVEENKEGETGMENTNVEVMVKEVIEQLIQEVAADKVELADKDTDTNNIDALVKKMISTMIKDVADEKSITKELVELIIRTALIAEEDPFLTFFKENSKAGALVKNKTIKEKDLENLFTNGSVKVGDNKKLSIIKMTELTYYKFFIKGYAGDEVNEELLDSENELLFEAYYESNDRKEIRLFIDDEGKYKVLEHKAIVKHLVEKTKKEEEDKKEEKPEITLNTNIGKAFAALLAK